MSMQLEQYSARKVYFQIEGGRGYLSKDEIVLILRIMQDSYEGSYSVHEVDSRDEKDVAFEINDLNGSLVGVFSYIEIYSDLEDPNVGKIAIFGDHFSAITLEETLFGLFMLQGYCFEKGENNEKCICPMMKKMTTDCKFVCPIHGQQNI